MEVEKTEMIVSNGNDQKVAQFKVHVEGEDISNVYLKSITFKLQGFGSEEEELAFYNALDNFYFIVSGITMEKRVDAVLETATQMTLNPLYPMYIYSTVDDHRVTIDVMVKNINAMIPLLNGSIAVEKVIFGTGAQIGINSEEIKASWDPNRGLSNATAIMDSYDEQIPNWQSGKVTILNDTITLEECTEAEVQMNDGSCAYNQCELISCGEGECSINRNSGAAECECNPGFGTWGNSMISCDQRLARFDIETSHELMHVPNGEQVLIAEWNISLNNVENAKLALLNMEISGDKDSFSNFKLGFFHKTYSNILFGEVQNESLQDSEDLDDMSITFAEMLDEAETFELNKAESTMIRLYATVNDNSGNQITAKLKSTTILSKDIEDMGPNYGLALRSDYQLGEDPIQNSIAGSGYLYQVNPIARIQ